MKLRRDPLDTRHSEFIRRRAIQRTGGCERCLRPKFDIKKKDGSILPAWKQLDCSHYHKRRKMATRFDEDNCNGFCFGCHQHFEEERDEYTAWLKRHLGERSFDLLEGRTRIIGKPDRKAIELYLIVKINALRVKYGIRNNSHILSTCKTQEDKKATWSKPWTQQAHKTL